MQLVAISMLDQLARFKHRARVLLQIDRHAVGALQNGLHDQRRQRLAARQAVDDGLALLAGQPLEIDGQKQRQLAETRVGKFGAEGQHQKHGLALDLGAKIEQKGQRAGVGPVQVFTDHGNGRGRAACRQRGDTAQPGHHPCIGALPGHDRREVGRDMAGRQGN